MPLDQFDPAPPPTGDGGIAVDLVSALPDRPLRTVSPRMELAPDGFRFRWDDEAVFDGHVSGTVSVLPGRAWSGTLPAAFYSTVTATLLAWRGLVPMHMSSVVQDGRAWLIAGAGGAGKSTLTAELVAAGAEFLADDLSVLRADEGVLMVTRGRPAIRLYPSAARLIDCKEIRPLADDERGKLLAWPQSRAADRAFPIGGIIVLTGPDGGSPDGADMARVLAGSVFRPRILFRTPAAGQIEQHVHALATEQRVQRIPALAFPDPAQRAERLAQVLAFMRAA